MLIQSALPLSPRRLSPGKPPEAPAPPLPSDSMEKTCGAVGAMAGALLVGRPAVVLAGAAAGVAAGSALGGTLGAVAGGLLGAYGGLKLELKTKVGRLAGGLVGGGLGCLVGKAAGALGASPAQALAEECKNFSLRSLPSKLLDPHYTSHSKISPEVAAEGASQAQPGDLIITNDDGDFMFELGQKAMNLVSRGYGLDANWTHIYMVDHNQQVMDILLSAGGPSRFPLTHAFTDNCHAKILRPQYSSPEHRERVLKNMNDKFGKVDYDLKFDWKSDQSQYCQEFVGKAIMAEDPALGLKTSQLWGGREFMSADNYSKNPNFPEVYSTGSNFWINWLSHFT